MDLLVFNWKRIFETTLFKSDTLWGRIYWVKWTCIYGEYFFTQ